MFINEKKNAIELSKKEAAAAAKFGTREYKALQEARKDYPGFKVVTIARKSAAKKESCKGLTYGYMEMYIQKHDDEEKSIMAEYLMLRGLSKEAAAGRSGGLVRIKSRYFLPNVIVKR